MWEHMAVLGSSTKVQSSATLQYRVCSSMVVVAYHYITIHIEIHRVSALRRLFRIFQQLRLFRINKLNVHSHPICICISELTVSKIRKCQTETKKKYFKKCLDVLILYQTSLKSQYALFAEWTLQNRFIFIELHCTGPR